MRMERKECNHDNIHARMNHLKLQFKHNLGRRNKFARHITSFKPKQFFNLYLWIILNICYFALFVILKDFTMTGGNNNCRIC